MYLSYNKCLINIDFTENIFKAEVYSGLIHYLIFCSLILASISLRFFRDPGHVSLSCVGRHLWGVTKHKIMRFSYDLMPSFSFWYCVIADPI